MHTPFHRTLETYISRHLKGDAHHHPNEPPSRVFLAWHAVKIINSFQISVIRPSRPAVIPCDSSPLSFLHAPGAVQILPHLGQIDHDLDHLDPNLPL